MNNKILAVDLDETCVSVLPLWLSWCNTMFDKQLRMEDINFNYDLTQVFGKAAIDFWSTPNLYDYLVPMEGCVEALSGLCDNGWQIGFVSYTKKSHFESKCNFINKWFPFRSFIHNTKEKNFTRCDYFIDDRNYYLNIQPECVTPIKMSTPYTQDVSLSKEVMLVLNWKQLYNNLLEINCNE